MKVLFISDELAAAKIWEFSLLQQDLEVTLIEISEPYLDIWEREIPDLVIIEDFNDQIEELEICKELRKVTVAPILYMTAKTSEKYQVDVYQAGADECIHFPISPRIFQAKVNAWLRRTMSVPMAALNEIAAGGFRLNPGRRVIIRPGQEPARLTILETRMLVLLMSNPGRVLTAAEIAEKVWAYPGVDDRKLVKNHIFRLRRKLERDPNEPCYLISVGRNGYAFRPGET